MSAFPYRCAQPCVVFLHGALVILCVGEHFEEHRPCRFASEQGDDSELHLLHVGGPQVAHVVLRADALCVGFVIGGHYRVAGRALFQSAQQVEDASAVVVEQHYAQVAAQRGVPKGVLVVEEA